MYGLLRDMELIDAMRFGSACAAITLTGMSCAEAMPNVKQTEEFLKVSTFKKI